MFDVRFRFFLFYDSFMPSHPILHETVNTAGRSQMIEVTARVATFVQQRHVRDGYVIVYVPHTTAACTIQENADPDVQHDLLTKLEQLMPQIGRHFRYHEGTCA